MSEYYDQIFCEIHEEYSIVIEDDGRVCYAYLLQDDKIIGDIWLYNQSDAPSKTEWRREDMPFLNPREFLKDGIVLKPITSDKEIGLEWVFSDKSGVLDQVRIFIHGLLTAIVKPDSKPGWSVNVVKDGPLACRAPVPARGSRRYTDR